jgi:hypothetical protein
LWHSWQQALNHHITKKAAVGLLALG